jgi:hypothetical protein
MAETRKPVNMVEVDRTCDQCGVGKMRPTGDCLTVHPPLFRHTCDRCGHRVTYPYTEIQPSRPRFDSWGDDDREDQADPVDLFA